MRKDKGNIIPRSTVEEIDSSGGLKIGRESKPQKPGFERLTEDPISNIQEEERLRRCIIEIQTID